MGLSDKIRKLLGMAERKNGITITPLGAFAYADVYAREGYMDNPVFYKALNLKASACASVPLYVVRRIGDAEKPVDDDEPIARLLERPGTGLSRQEFIRRIIINLGINGSAYIMGIGQYGRIIGPDNPPISMTVLRPERVKINVKNNSVIGYEYDNGEGDKTVIPPENVLRLCYYHPLYDFEGYSPAKALRDVIRLSNTALEYDISLLRNSATPSLIVSFKNALTAAQRRQLEYEFTQYYAGASNAGKLYRIEGDATVQKAGLSPSEMSWKEALCWSNRIISMVCGVPPQMTGDTESQTYANYEQAELSFHMDTVFPELEWICGELSYWLQGCYGSGYRITYDRDSVPAIQRQRAELAQTLASLISYGVLSPDEARAYIGEAETGLDGMDRHYISAGLVPIDQTTPPENPESAEGDGTDAEREDVFWANHRRQT